MPITREVLSRYVNPVFVETGTHRGDTVQLALDLDFAEVYSIEIDEELYWAARDRFATEPRAHLLWGDTLRLLPDVLDRIDGAATLWLDAHRSGDLRGGPRPYPLLDELAAIRRHARHRHTILIDDRRLMSTEFGMREADVIAALRAIDGAYDVAFEPGVVPDDIMVARPRLPQPAMA